MKSCFLFFKNEIVSDKFTLYQINALAVEVTTVRRLYKLVY